MPRALPRTVVCAAGGLLLAHCGLSRLSAEYGAEDGDGGSPDAAELPRQDGGQEAGLSGPRCAPDGPFETPVPVTGVPTAVHGFAMTGDETRAYYAVNGVLFFAEAIGPMAFEPGVAVSVSGGPDAGTLSMPRLTQDMKTLFYEQDFAVWRAAGTAGGPYQTSTRVGPQNTGLGQPDIDERRGLLYVAEYTQTGGFHRSLMRAPYDGGAIGTWEKIELGPSSNLNPIATLEPDTIYFATERERLRGSDIYVASNIQTGDASVRRIDAVNSATADVPAWLSLDGCLLYLMSARETGFDARLYLARRAK